MISPGTERTIIDATKTEGWLSHEYPAAGQDVAADAVGGCA